MAKKQHEPEPPPQAEKKRVGGRTIASWKKDVFARFPNGTDEEIAEAVNRIAEDGGYDYKATAEQVAKWKADDSSEPRRRRDTAAGATKSEPTLADLFIVKEAADEAGEDSERFLRTIQTVATLAEKVGGLANLQKCLEALAKLSPK